jgi:tetratricopeptide (TPR) repeat protein
MVMRAQVALIFSAGLMLTFSSPAWSLSATALSAYLHNCQTDGVDADVRIKACSDLIHSNLATPAFLARLYADRARAYENKGDRDDAMKDYDKALELKPDFTEAQAARSRLTGDAPK